MHAAHAAKRPTTNHEDCLLLVPQFTPQERIADEEEPYHQEAQWTFQQGLDHAIIAAQAANDYMRYTRYAHRNTQLELAAERNYASLVLACVYLQNKVEEWGAPTMWTDGEVDEDGFVTIWNDGANELECWQGGEMDQVSVNENGIGMRNA
jgi:hypothetical protein